MGPLDKYTGPWHCTQCGTDYTGDPQSHTCPLPNRSYDSPTGLDRFTDSELCQMHLDTYRRGLAHFEEADRLLSVMSGAPYPSPEYEQARAQMRVAMAAGTEAHELLRHIGAVSRARRANADA